MTTNLYMQLPEGNECVHLLFADEPDTAVTVCGLPGGIPHFLCRRKQGRNCRCSPSDRRQTGIQGHCGEAIATYQNAVNILKGIGRTQENRLKSEQHSY